MDVPRLIAVLLFLIATPGLAEPGGPHVDPEGNPLPAEAIARIGSSRLRVGGPLLHAVYSPDGQRIVAVVPPDKLQVWEAATGKLLRTIATEMKSTPALAWDGDAIVLYSWGAVRTVDVTTGKELRRLALSDTPPPFCAALAPGGQTLALGEAGGPVRLIDVATGKEKRRWPCQVNFPLSLAFTPDGKTLAVNTANAIPALRHSRAAARGAGYPREISQALQHRAGWAQLARH